MDSERHSTRLDPFDELVEEYLRRCRCGERPTPAEYAARYPELAPRILEFFPALELIERLKPTPEDCAGHSDGTGSGGTSLVVGDRLQRLGDFRVLREIGRGGMGVVYEAEQESLGRRVALKVMSGHRLSDVNQLERFTREAKAAARLHHTNIVPVFGVGQEEGVHYYVMQFIQGQGLDAVLSELRRLEMAPETPTVTRELRPGEISAAAVAQSLIAGTFSGVEAQTAHYSSVSSVSSGLPCSDALDFAVSSGSSLVLSGKSAFGGSVARIGLQAAEGLAYAHEQGILHRDIKPSNLLLDAQGIVWITDFGLAKATTDSDLTHTGDILGTIRYMAPERFEGRCDAGADVYALGLTLYELLAKRPAFDEADRGKLIKQVTDTQPPPLRTLDRTIARDLATIVHKAIERELSHRYRSADDLADDLRRFLEDRPILARRVSAAERLARWCRRNSVVAGLLAAVFVLLATVAGVASVGYVQTKRALNGESEQRALAQEAEAKAKGEAGRALAAEQEIRRQWYAATVNLMQPAWDTGQVNRLRSLLAETEAYPERGFEWYYWQRLCHLEQHTFIGHRSTVWSASWSPDGTRLATGSDDGTAKVWDAASGREPLTLRGYAGPVYSVAWSPDGTRLATGSQDGTAKVWDAASDRDPRTLEGHACEVTSVSWSPDGTRLATGSEDNTARVWDVAGGRELFTLKGHGASLVTSLAYSRGVRSVSWSRDGTRLATGSGDGTAKIWLASGGPELLTLKGHTSGVTSVSWSPDGTRLSTGSRDGTAKVWDAARGGELLTLRGHTSVVMSVAWSRDGTRLATGSDDGTVKVWEAAGGQELLTLKGHTSQVSSVSWSPDGTRLATGSGDGTAKAWDAAGGRQPLTLRGHTGRVISVSWSPDGQRLATGSDDGKAKVWDAASGRERLTLEGHAGEVSSVSWSPDGHRLATGGYDNTAKVRDAAGGRELRTLKGHTGPVWSVSWSPDGTRLATGSMDKTARVWEAAGGQSLLTLKEHTNRVISVSWSPDGTRLATGSQDGTVKVWEAAGGQPLLTLKASTHWVWSVSWSPDGARLATGSDDGPKVWDAADGDELLTLEGHTNMVSSVSWSPDGTRLATGSADSTAKVWDAAGGRELLTLKGHTGPVYRVFWSPDGQRLATGSWDGTVKVWDAASAQAVREWARQDRAVQDHLERNQFLGSQAQGFLQTWLLLLPLPFASGESCAQALDRPQLPGEAEVQPRPRERVVVDGRPLLWQEYRSQEAVVNFHAVVEAVDRSVAYAVCYLESDEARDGLWLQVGCDDQAKVYLNGRQIYRVRLPRHMWTVDTVGPVRLERGINVLLFKVVNETDWWECCARLVDDAGRPAEGLHVRLSP
jgi:WD40 repeat protein/serine/threonine protein kinase